MAEEEEPKAKIIRVFETVAFDPEKGSYRAVDVRFEYPVGSGNYYDIVIPFEEYTPEEAERRVREWVQKYGSLMGKEL